MGLYQKYRRTITWFLWKVVDYDWVYANQCVDWVKVYARSLGYVITTSWNAKDFATKWLGKSWKRVIWSYQYWDIVVFPSWTYGHIAVLSQIEWCWIYVYDQNSDWKAYKNNDSNNLGASVKLSKYRIKWNEVYFRVNS